MKVIKRFTWVLLLTLCSTTLFVGCSDDDDDNGGKEPEVGGKIDPSTVFTGKLPKSYAGSAVTYNNEGLVTKIVTEDEEVTFTYPSSTTKASNAKQVVRMTIFYPDYPEEGNLYLDMTLGDNGYVESCRETYDMDGDIDTWEFGYNSDSQLNYMMRSENDNRRTRITYEGGNITRIEETSDLNEHYGGTVSYGENPIDNKGCIMLFDATFSIDMDEMQFAYLAGLLGKATKHLPVSYTDTGSGSSNEYTFDWKLDSNSYPVTATLNGYEYQFSWK